MNKDEFLDAVAPMGSRISRQCGSTLTQANPVWPSSLGQWPTAPAPQPERSQVAMKAEVLVSAYAQMQIRLHAYHALMIAPPDDFEEEMASLARKAKAAHREAQEAERQALREEIKALQSKEQKRKDAEAKLAALEEKLK